MLRRGMLWRRRVSHSTVHNPRGGAPGYRLAGLLLAALLSSAIPAAAQATGGVIVGVVVDGQGGVLPGVTLTLRNTETGVTRTTVTESDGAYRLAGLPPGRYDLTAELQGFAPVDVKDLVVTIGLELQRELKLGLQGVQESLTVTGEAPIVETTRTEIASVITQQQIESLPVEGRQPVGLALLLPGTSTDGIRPRRANANIGSGGASHSMTAFHVDGGMNWSNNAGEARIDLPTSAIREFKVNVSQASAEFGGNTGGVVNIVTKSGTNQFHGEAFEYFRDKSLNAMNTFEQQAQDELGEPKPEYRRNQFGAGIGGPVLRDRLHFFFSAEHTNVQEEFTVNTGQPEFYRALEGTFPREDTANIVFARGDLQLTPQQSLFARYVYMGETNTCESCGATNAAFSDQAVYSPRDSVVFGHTWVIGSRALNEVRIQSPWGARFDFLTAPPGETFWDRQGDFSPERYAQHTPEFVFPSLAWGSSASSFNTTHLKEFRNDFSITFGDHTMKAGGAYLDIPSPEDVPNNALGTWTFARDQFFDGSSQSIANLTGATRFQASFPPLTRELENHWIQAYVQDDWKVRSNLTLNLGLRYDLQHNAFNQNLDLSLYPRPLPYIDPKSRGDFNNIGPRLGVAWDVFGNGRSVARGGYGLYYQYVMQGPLRGEITALRQTAIDIRNPSYPDPYQGRDPLTFASTALPNIDIVANDIRNPKSNSANVGWSQELRANLALHVDGVYTKIDDMTFRENVNTIDLVTNRRPLADFNRIRVTGSRQTHEYKALFFRLDKRFANRNQFLLSYTLAGQENYGSGTSPDVTDFFNPQWDFGPGNADRRHALVASGSIVLPYDITLGAIWTLRSGMPFSARAGTDLNRDTATTDYVPGTTRNQGNRGNAGWLDAVNAYRSANGLAPVSEDQIDTNEQNAVNLRLGKSLNLGGNRRLELIAQVFNLFGRDNLLPVGGGWVENALSNSFGRILSAQNDRQAELAIRIAF